jgi:hypothetical protein
MERLADVGQLVRRILFALTLLLSSAAVSVAEQVSVRFAEGLTHGFLVLRTLDGSRLADGDLVQTVRGSRVTKRMVFHFKDGSQFRETTIFSQRGRFRLLTYHLAQAGPSFPHRLDMRIDALAGRVTVRYTDDQGHAKVEAQRLGLPPDLANGLMPILLKNIDRAEQPREVPLVAATPKPRLVTVEIAGAGEERFATGLVSRRATHYVVKVDLGGFAGLVAPLMGKAPPDSHVWILGGTAPTFVRSEQPLYAGGPLWRIEAVSPVWPR